MRRLLLILAVVLAVGCQEAEPVISADEAAPSTTDATPTTTTTTMEPSPPQKKVPRLEGKNVFEAEQLLPQRGPRDRGRGEVHEPGA
jgi:hypothetical protein